MGPFDFEQLHLLETSLDQERGGFFGTRTHHGRIKARERHARHPDQRFEVGEVGLLFFGESPEGEVNRHAGWIAPPASGHHTVCKGPRPSHPARQLALPPTCPNYPGADPRSRGTAAQSCHGAQGRAVRFNAPAPSDPK